MKIAFIADSYLMDPWSSVNGTQVQMYQLAHAFARRGHEIHFIFSRPGHATELLFDDGVRLREYKRRPGALKWVLELREAGRLLREINPDAVYQRGRSPLTWIAARWARRTGKVFVWGSNGEDSGDWFKYLGRLRRSHRPWIARCLLTPDMWLRDLTVHSGIRGATHIVAQTEHQRERLLRNFGKVATVLASYFPTPAAEKAPEDRKTILWLANVNRSKQPEIFIDLARHVADIDGWQYCLAGSSNDAALRRELHDSAKDIPRFAFVEDVPFIKSGDYYARACVYVNTSRSDADGLPNAFIQAWLHATPVLSLNHDPNNWMRDHGIGHCSHGDIEDLRRTLRTWLETPDVIEPMRNKCQAFARERFADETVIDSYLALFAGRDAAITQTAPVSAP